MLTQGNRVLNAGGPVSRLSRPGENPNPRLPSHPDPKEALALPFRQFFVLGIKTRLPCLLTLDRCKLSCVPVLLIHMFHINFACEDMGKVPRSVILSRAKDLDSAGGILAMPKTESRSCHFAVAPFLPVRSLSNASRVLQASPELSGIGRKGTKHRNSSWTQMAFQHLPWGARCRTPFWARRPHHFKNGREWQEMAVFSWGSPAR